MIRYKGYGIQVSWVDRVNVWESLSGRIALFDGGLSMEPCTMSMFAQDRGARNMHPQTYGNYCRDTMFYATMRLGDKTIFQGFLISSD